MIDESKLIFFTGAPGSKWSAVSFILGHSPFIQINTSDRNDDRCYSHPERFNGVRHVGSYFGPGFEFGNNFHNINHLSKDEILAEMDKPFSEEQPDSYRIIRCHQFAHNLDWIAETFPKSKIMAVLRSEDNCDHGWFGAGGFNITYPTYEQYYQNDSHMRTHIADECRETKKWVHNNDVKLHVAQTSHWRDHWGIDNYENGGELDRYIRSVDGYMMNAADPLYNLKYDVTLAYWNFE